MEQIYKKFMIELKEGLVVNAIKLKDKEDSFSQGKYMAYWQTLDSLKINLQRFKLDIDPKEIEFQ